MTDGILQGYEALCLIAGDVVLAMAVEGRETRRAAIAGVLRTEMLKCDQRDPDELRAMMRAVLLLEGGIAEG